MTAERTLSPARRALFLAAPLLLFLALLAGIEGLVRLTRPHLRPLELFVTFPRQQAMFVDRRNVAIFEADPLLFWKLIPGLRQVMWDGTVVSTNAQGLRYASDIGPKAAGAVRIVCMGDSVTFGFRVPRVFPNQPDVNPNWLAYPALLERALRTANPGRVIEVIPMAVPGYSSHQGRLWAARDLARLQPDLVTACYGWNDIDRRPRGDAETMKPGWAHVTSRRLVSRSQAMMRLVRALQPGAPSASAAAASRGTMRVEREAYVANVRRILETARSSGARVAAIAPVYRDNVAHPPEGEEIAGHRAALGAAMAQDGVPWLLVPELTESAWPANDPLFEEHIHPNHRGHRLLAARLQALIARDALLPGLVVPQPDPAPSP